MIQTRAIPVLLLTRKGLVKTVKFKDPTYLGDPINIVRIFNDKEVDEIVVLDIEATPAGRGPDIGRITSIVSEAFMPVCYGGGITTLDDVRRLIAAGIEKIALNTAAVENPALVSEAAKLLGSSSVVVSIDVQRRMLRGQRVVTRGAARATEFTPVDFARRMEAAGAGEILLNSVDRDGTQSGYDTELVRAVSAAVSIPVVACGGARDAADLGSAVQAGASAAAAGSLFVFRGPHRAVLISYPSPAELARVFQS